MAVEEQNKNNRVSSASVADWIHRADDRTNPPCDDEEVRADKV